jgi:hypothetical protein
MHIHTYIYWNIATTLRWNLKAQKIKKAVHFFKPTLVGKPQAPGFLVKQTKKAGQFFLV